MPTVSAFARAIRTFFSGCICIIAVAPVTGAIESSTAADSLDMSECGSALPIDRVQFDRVPVRTIEDWLALQPGVTVPYPGSRELHIRGSRDYQNTIFLNGVRSENPFTGQLATTFSPYAIGSLRLLPDGGGARYGAGIGGLITISSPAGGEKISGSASAVTDNLGSDFGQNWYDVTLSGPLGSHKNLRFFTAAERRYFRDHFPSSRAEAVLPGEEKELPANAQKGWSYHGKLDWMWCERTSLSAWGDYSLDDIQTYSHEFYYYPEHSPRTEDKTLSIGTSIDHDFSQEVNLHASAYYYRYESVHGDGVVFADLAAYDRGVLNPDYDGFDLFRDTSAAGDVPYYDYFVKRKAAYMGFDAALKVAAGPRHAVTAGIDARRYTVRLYENLIPSLSYSDVRVNRYGYDEQANESDDDGGFDGPKHPVFGGVYLQDRIQLENLTITAAARIDYWDLAGKVLRDAEQPFGSDNTTLDAEDLVDGDSYVRFSPRLTVAGAVSDRATVFGSLSISHQLPPFLYTYTGYQFLEARVLAGRYSVFGNPSLEPEKVTRGEAGVSARLTDKVRGTAIGFYADRTNMLMPTSVPAVPTSYDVYASHTESSSLGAEVNLALEPAPYAAIDLSYTLTSTRSPDVFLSNIAWKVGSNTTEEWPVADDQTHKFVGVFDFHTGHGEGPRLGNRPLLQDLSLGLVVYAASGFRYTQGEPADEVSGSTVAQNPAGDPNQERSPAIFRIDLKLQRTIRLGDFNLVPFLWVRNLLDRENIIHVYNGTGEPDNTGYLGTIEGQSRASDPIDGDEFVRQYELRQNDPNNFAAPRQIYVGLRAEF